MLRDDELVEITKMICETEEQARFSLGDHLGQIKARCSTKERFLAACGEVGISYRHAEDLVYTAKRWPEERRLPISWTAHRELAKLADKDGVDPYEMASVITAWGQRIEDAAARLESRSSKPILYPSTRLIRRYRQFHYSKGPASILVPISLAKEVLTLAQETGREDISSVLSRKIADRESP